MLSQNEPERHTSTPGTVIQNLKALRDRTKQSLGTAPGVRSAHVAVGVPVRPYLSRISLREAFEARDRAYLPQGRIIPAFGHRFLDRIGREDVTASMPPTWSAPARLSGCSRSLHPMMFRAEQRGVLPPKLHANSKSEKRRPVGFAWRFRRLWRALVSVQRDPSHTSGFRST